MTGKHRREGAKDENRREEKVTGKKKGKALKRRMKRRETRGQENVKRKDGKGKH